ncbi:ChbG/HpnK family deacetylase [Thermosinus carboxydivorans]|uniref:ChbG/HpnK family deacetylase n=1 Tax=Thermosinus carboxydivorans TaxID=261685 RepID=UPI001E399215|nr:ChbG/HpnK family deacetylase [Thermosinus carboxydivorans]
MILIKRLIVNADDFGLHESINNAIIASHREGCVTSASLMAGGNAFDHAVALARQHPRLSVGVHLTLVGARPVARGNIHTLLTDDGKLLPDYGAFARRYFRGAIAKEHIEYELRCQMQKVVGSGIIISHIDSHQHLHAMPGMAAIVAKIAREFQVTKIRIPAEPLSFFPKQYTVSRVLARTALTVCAAWARRQYARSGLKSPQYFFGMLTGGTMHAANLKAVIENLPEGLSEIMVHPGMDNKVLDAAYGWRYQWQEELAALRSAEILGALRRHKIKLINYWELDDETS